VMLMSIDSGEFLLTVLFRGHVVPMFEIWRDNFYILINLRGFELCKDHCTVQNTLLV